MRMLEGDGQERVRQLRLYLSRSEAGKLRDELEALLRSPEANEHFHLFSEEGGGYTPEELRALKGWRPKP